MSYAISDEQIEIVRVADTKVHLQSLFERSPSKRVIFVTRISGGWPLTNQEAHPTTTTRRKHARERAMVCRGLYPTGTSESKLRP